MKTNYEPLVPVADLYSNRAGHDPSSADVEYLARVYRVSVLRDHADRPAVTLSDAYKIRDECKAAEAELEAERAASSLRANQMRVWFEARVRFMERNWISVRRSIPDNGSIERTNTEAMKTLAARVTEAEVEAGIPPEIQRALRWPQVAHSYETPAPGEDTSYEPPKEFA